MSRVVYMVLLVAVRIHITRCDAASDCDAGFAGPVGGACGRCGAGRYSAANATACSVCAEGKYSATAGAGQCTTCMLGKTSYSIADDIGAPQMNIWYTRGMSRWVMGTTNANCDNVCASAGLQCKLNNVRGSLIFYGDGSKTHGMYPLSGNTQTYLWRDYSNCDLNYDNILHQPATRISPSYFVQHGNKCSIYQLPSGATFQCATAGSWTGNGVLNQHRLCPCGNNVDQIALPARAYVVTGQTSCLDCAAGKYHGTGDDRCVSCADGHTTDRKGATNVSECVACGVGKYRSYGLCVQCPAGSSSPAASNRRLDCVCSEPGYGMAEHIRCEICALGTFQLHGLCAPCGPGFGTASVGALQCEIGCAADEYSTNRTCAPCPANSWSRQFVPGLHACQCGAGYTGTANESCAICDAGTYKSVNGSARCTNCAAGKYSATDGAVVCDTCPMHSDSPAASPGIAACACNAGSTGPDGGTCTLCAINTYKAHRGNATCDVCPYNSISLAGSTFAAACRCNAGTTGDGTCSLCVAGSYKALSGTASCDMCTANSNSPVASTTAAACSCNAGSTRDGNACLLCVAGKYKLVLGDAACVECASGTYAVLVGATTASVCSACPTNSSSLTGSSELTACACNAGSTGPDGGTCVLCAAGTHKALPGSAECTACVPGKHSSIAGALTNSTCGACVADTYSWGGTVNCSACPDNTRSPAESTTRGACTCVAGWTGPDGGTCTACAAGKYKATGAASCTACPPGTYSVLVGATNVSACLECPIYTDSFLGSTNSTACTCNAGSTGPDGGPCAVCPANSDSPGGNIACACTAGATGPDGGHCSLCATGTYKATQGDASCSNCTTGTYSTTVGAASNDECRECPANSDAPPASNAETDCICNTGFWGVGSGCTACGAGTYMLGRHPGIEACLSCPPHSHSPAASVSIAQCRCNAGYGASRNEGCNSCGAGRYSKAGFACTDCEGGTYSAALAASHCTPCAPNHFRLEPGAIKCDACSAGMISIPTFTACRVSRACPGWRDTMVDSTTAELLIPVYDMTDDEKIASFYILDMFVEHYEHIKRQSEDRITPTCTDIYDRAISRMRSNRGSTGSASAGTRDSTANYLVVCINVIVVMACVFSSYINI